MRYRVILPRPVQRELDRLPDDVVKRQNDRADLEDMAKDIALPEVTQHAIMNYPLPDHQAGQKYSPFTYLHTDSNRNLCGTVHNVSRDSLLLQFERRTLRPPRP